MASSDTPDKKWLEGSCHCSAVQYKAFVPDPYTNPTIACNCSVCTKNGHLATFALKKDVIFHQGTDTLRDYQFGSRKVTHKFCGNCGSSVYIDFNGNLPQMGDSMGMNVRMFQDIDLDKLDLKKFDGKNLLL